MPKRQVSNLIPLYPFARPAKRWQSPTASTLQEDHPETDPSFGFPHGGVEVFRSDHIGKKVNKRCMGGSYAFFSPGPGWPPTTPVLTKPLGRIISYKWTPVSLAIRSTPSPVRRNCLVPCNGPDCTCSVVATKLCVIIHNFAHQPFDQLLADRTVLAAS